jgi:hypothetical protein
MPDLILIGMLVKQLAHLGPVLMLARLSLRCLKHGTIPRNKINEHVMWRCLLLLHWWNQPIRMCIHVLDVWPYEELRKH